MRWCCQLGRCDRDLPFERTGGALECLWHEKGWPLATYVFGLWAGIAVVSGLAALAGYAIFAGFSADVIAATEAIAAGAILAMIADTMILEAFEVAHDYAGLITVTGFLAAFGLSKLGGG